MRHGMTAVIGVLLAALLVPAPALADDLTYEEAALAACPDGDLHCVRRGEQEMKKRTRALARKCDHDVIFALVYTRVTQAYRQTVEQQPEFFSDPAWVNYLGTAFADFYFGAYDAWHQGQPTAAPAAWDTAFKAAQDQTVSASGNLLLGINAHVIRDLPFVLAGVGELTDAHKVDYDKVNVILREVYPEVIDEIASRFDPSMDDSDVAWTHVDEDALFKAVVAWREEAWRDAQQLTAADSPLLRATVATAIEADAQLRAETLRAQGSYPPLSGPEARNAYCAAHG